VDAELVSKIDEELMELVQLVVLLLLLPVEKPPLLVLLLLVELDAKLAIEEVLLPRDPAPVLSKELVRVLMVDVVVELQGLLVHGV
jgi:hypothetical protein